MRVGILEGRDLVIESPCPDLFPAIFRAVFGILYESCLEKYLEPLCGKHGGYNLD